MLASFSALRACSPASEAFALIPDDLAPLALLRGMQVLPPVPANTLRSELLDLRHEKLIKHLPIRIGLFLRVLASARNETHTIYRTKRTAREYDSDTITILVNESDQFVRCRSSCFPKTCSQH